MQLEGSGGALYAPPVGSGAKPQPTNFWCILKAKIIALGVTFLWFDEEKIEHFAKLKQKMAKDRDIKA